MVDETELIQSAGAVRRGHHSRYHRFFANAAWSIDDLYEALARELLQHFCHERGRDAVFLGNFIGAARVRFAMRREVLDGDQAVVGFFGQLKHLKVKVSYCCRIG